MVRPVVEGVTISFNPKPAATHTPNPSPSAEGEGSIAFVPSPFEKGEGRA
jgi:hypothetical protein